MAILAEIYFEHSWVFISSYIKNNFSVFQVPARYPRFLDLLGVWAISIIRIISFKSESKHPRVWCVVQWYDSVNFIVCWFLLQRAYLWLHLFGLGYLSISHSFFMNFCVLLSFELLLAYAFADKWRVFEI